MTPRGISNSLEASTLRRRRVLHYAKIGLGTGQIAAATGLSPRTVQRHLRHEAGGRPPLRPGGICPPEKMAPRDARGWFIPKS